MIVEKISSDYFYGLDIDHPFNMAIFGSYDIETKTVKVENYYNDALGVGIRPPVWCFLLSPYWLKKLGKTTHEVIQYFSHNPMINITPIQYDDGIGLWIQLGELNLYPKEQGLPPILVLANQLIKPIRCDHLKLVITDIWDDDPNPRFDEQSSLQWMQRFDMHDK